MIKLKLFSLLAIYFLLCGCGPIYNTQNIYKPPKSNAGMMCIATCESNKGNCHEMRDMQKQECDYRAEREYRDCQRDAERNHEDKNKCYHHYCSADYSGCDSQYDTCYQACGGIITQQQTCVAFCK